MREVYSPSELNREVRLHLEAGFPRLWVEGEISNLSRPASGHYYFSLKDDQAQIRCALFRAHAGQLTFRPENGQLVQVRGRLSLYEPRGEYQLIADAMQAAGEGRLRAAFEALKKKLEAEGLFAAERKQALPAFPRRIAVITSPTGAVIRDILQVLQRRWPLAAVRLYPVPVQGTEAPAAIARALAAADRHAWAEVLIVARGGGSLEDLQAFNEESVARAIHACRLPVISAVGHETDFSICDFVADLRAPTPSAAAEMVAPDGPALSQTLAGFGSRLSNAMRDHVSRIAQRQDELSGRLQRQHPRRRLEDGRQRLDAMRTRLHSHARRLAPDRQRLLAYARSRLLAEAGHLLPRQRQMLAEWHQRLHHAGRRLLPERSQRLAGLARTLHALSPLPTLARGFAVVMDAESGATVTSAASVRVGQALVTQLQDGRLASQVTAIELHPPNLSPET